MDGRDHAFGANKHGGAGLNIDVCSSFHVRYFTLNKQKTDKIRIGRWAGNQLTFQHKYLIWYLSLYRVKFNKFKELKHELCNRTASNISSRTWSLEG